MAELSNQDRIDLIAKELADRRICNGTFQSASGLYYGLSPTEGLYGPPREDAGSFFGDAIEFDPSVQAIIEESIERLPSVHFISPDEIIDRLDNLRKLIEDLG